MKKFLYSFFVIALFAIGFAASSDSEGSDEVYYDAQGKKYHKRILKCVKCGDTTWYWEADDGSGSLNRPSSHIIDGKYYCGKSTTNCFPD